METTTTEPADGFQLRATGLGKQFYNRWLFRQISLQLRSGERLAIIGRNGAGKSTLLRMLAGQMIPTEGRVSCTLQGSPVPAARLQEHVSWAAPYVDLYPDLTLAEHIQLHFRFRNCLLDDPASLIPLIGLEAHAGKPLRFYSSGMYQRARVGLALATRADLLLLDEPTSNLDEATAEQMFRLIERFSEGRILILASNLHREYSAIPQRIYLGDGASGGNW